MSIKLYTNLEEGYIHIASEEKYQGNLRYYENFFARFFLHLFCFSVDIQVNGKEYRVNRRTFVHLLHSMGVKNATWKTASLYKDLNHQTLQPITTKGFMRAQLSIQKVYDLGLKLFEEFTGTHNIEKIKDLLGEGADPDILFSYDGYNKQYSFGWGQKAQLPYRTVPPITEYQLTPLLAAATTKEDKMVALLLLFGANQQIQGSQHLFSRTLLKTSSEVVSTPDVGQQEFLIQEFQDDWFNYQRIVFHTQEIEFSNCPEKAHKRLWSERKLVQSK